LKTQFENSAARPRFQHISGALVTMAVHAGR